jgi:hypothetical protein
MSILQQIQSAVAFRQLLQGLTIGGVAYKQAQLLHAGQLLSDAGQAGKKEIAYGKASCLG